MQQITTLILQHWP